MDSIAIDHLLSTRRHGVEIVTGYVYDIDGAAFFADIAVTPRQVDAHA